MPVPLGTQTYYYGGKQLANPVAGMSGSGAPPSKVPAEAIIGQTTYTNTTTQAVYMLTSKAPVTWSILGEGPSGGFPITPYVVGASGAAGYQTVQSAVNAAHAAGGGTVYVQDGTYTENLTLFDKIQIVGVSGFRDAVAGATIIGVHTPPASGNFTFNNLTLQSATHIFNSAAAGTAHLILANCNTVITTGYAYNLANWTGTLEFWNTDSAGTTTDGGVNNTAGATVYVYSAGVGGGTANSMIVTGTLLSSQSNFYCPVNFQTGGTFTIDQATFAHTVTCSNNSTGTISSSHFSTGATAALTMSSTGAVSVLSTAITSSNNPAISGSGAGTLSLADVSFTSNSAVAGTLTIGTGTAYLPANYTAHGVLLGEGPGVIGVTAAGATGQVLTGSTGADPVWTNLPAFNFVDVTGTSQAVAINTTYIADNAGLVTFTLPATAAQGSTFSIVGNGAGGWSVAQNANQVIKLNGNTTTTGTGGSMSSTNRYNSAVFYATVGGASTTWVVRDYSGTFTFV